MATTIRRVSPTVWARCELRTSTPTALCRLGHRLRHQPSRPGVSVHLRRQWQPVEQDRRSWPHNFLHLQLARPEDHHDRAAPELEHRAAAATTNYTYDAFGNLTQTSAPLGRVTSSTYDGNGNKISDTDARGNTTNYQYDALNRLILTTYPDRTTASKTYDFRNNVVTRPTRPDTSPSRYDLAGRQTSVTQAYGTSNATTTSYTYDNAGRKMSETDASATPPPTPTTRPATSPPSPASKGNFTYAYDNARNRISMTDGNGHTTQYQYDARKRLT